MSGAISFQQYVSKKIIQLAFYVDIVYKLRRVKDNAKYISSASKIVKTSSMSSAWPSDHREDYTSCALPFYSPVQIIP